MKEFVLKILTKDEVGLIYKITKYFYEANLNITKNDEFVNEGIFYFRLEFEAFSLQEDFKEGLLKVLGKEAKVEINLKGKKDIVVFATKEVPVLGELLISWYNGSLKANIKAVIANHEDLKDLVDRFNLPFFHISTENITQDEHEKRVKEVLKALSFEYLVLAKYMRILSPAFTKEFKDKIINIHHSFLPAFIGANPYKQAYDRGVKLVGATAHFVNDCLDEGPIITQDVVAINHALSVKELKECGAVCEKSVLLKALKAVFEDRVFLKDNKTVVF